MNRREKTSKAVNEANIIQPFVGSEPYVSVTYTVPDNEDNIQSFSCIAIIDKPISLIKLDYAPINCRYPVTNDDF